MTGLITFQEFNGRYIPVGDGLGANVVAGWLDSDIQKSLPTADFTLSQISKVIEGTQPSGYQGTGNAFSICATPELFYCESEYIENSKVCIGTLDVFRIVKQYREFIESQDSDMKIDVSYFAEGNEAHHYYSSNGGVFESI